VGSFALRSSELLSVPHFSTQKPEEQSKAAAGSKSPQPAEPEERKPPKRSPLVPASEERKAGGQKRARGKG